MSTTEERNDTWMNEIYNSDSQQMTAIPDSNVNLIVSSPPYNVGIEYDSHEDDLSKDEYRELLENVFTECYRVLKSDGRLAVNVANLGRKPYFKLDALVHEILTSIGYSLRGEIIWNKGKAKARDSAAWGSWKSASNPCLRDVHEHILVYTVDEYGRENTGEDTIGKEEFMAGTRSVWTIKPETGQEHPAPFPEELASRLIELYSYKSDVVLDPFVGSGTTCVASKRLGRNYVGYDVSEKYCDYARERIRESQ